MNNLPGIHEEWLLLAKNVLRKKKPINEATFCGLFGVPPLVIYMIWLYIPFPLRFSTKKEHILFAFYYLKQNPTYAVGGAVFDLSATAYMKIVWEIIEILVNCLPELNWESRLKDPHDAIFPTAFTALDTTTCLIQKPSTSREVRKLFATYKKTYGIKYETAVCIASKKIVWASNPFPGHLNDLQIVHASNILSRLHYSEVVYADSIYYNAELLKLYHIVAVYPERKKKGPQKAYIETMNRYIRSKRVEVDRTFARVKNFGVVSSPWRNDLESHAKVFHLICKIVNVEIDVFPE